MSILKIVNYVIALIHIGVQFLFFSNISKRVGDFSILPAKVDATLLSNANLTLNQECFVYLGLAVFTLAFYLTLSKIFSQWILENMFEERELIQEVAMKK